MARIVTRVGLVGCGTVGSAVARRLLSPETPSHSRRFTLTHIFDRRPDDKRARLGLDAPIVWTSRIDDLLQSDVDIVVEAVGGITEAGDWVRRALGAGKSVVTANKQLVAHHGIDLWTLAERQGRQFRFEAAVGGAMPILRAITEGLAGDRITRIVGVLNGTTTAILSRMDATDCSFEDALADSRQRGYAEADPSLDLNGDDARAKLAILCALAFNVRVRPEAIDARTTANITPGRIAAARYRGKTIRQIAFAEFDRDDSTLSAWVAPIEVSRESALGRTAGPQNAAVVTCEHAGEIGIFGTGAGGDATAVAILGDLAAIARDRAAIVPAPKLTGNFRFKKSDSRLVESDRRFAEAV